MYEKNTLSECEMVTMRCVWNLGKDATAFNVINMLDEDYGLVYKETTVYTFLTKLKEKGFLDTVRNGVTYYIPRISEKEYLKKAAKQYLDFWFHGNVAAAVKEIMEGEKLSRKDAKSIREALRTCTGDGAAPATNHPQPVPQNLLM